MQRARQHHVTEVDRVVLKCVFTDLRLALTANDVIVDNADSPIISREKAAYTTHLDSTHDQRHSLLILCSYTQLQRHSRSGSECHATSSENFTSTTSDQTRQVERVDRIGCRSLGTTQGLHTQNFDKRLDGI